MKTHKTNLPPASSEQISITAHELWQQAGSPHGRDLEFWLAAEQKLKNDNRSAGTSGDSALRNKKSIAEDLDKEITPTPTAGNSRRSATAI